MPALFGWWAGLLPAVLAATPSTAGISGRFGLKMLSPADCLSGELQVPKNTTLRTIAPAGIIVALLTGSPAISQEHHDHHMTPEQFAELRQKVPLYQEFSDEQIIANMQRMGPNFREYLSDSDVRSKVGVLALGHGYKPDGNAKFAAAFKPTAEKYPTAMALGMAMMTSEHVQSAVDDLTAAGAETILVLPVTTLRDGGLTGQWRYIFDEQENAPWMSVPRAATDARIVMTPTPTTNPKISAILLDNAKQYSDSPANEVVALVAHGPDNAAANQLELNILADHAAIIKAQGGFADAQGFTLQDDAPTAVRAANVQRLRDWVRQATDDNRRVIVLTTLLFEGAVHDKIRRDLAGLDYQLVTEGVLDNPLFSTWIDDQISAAAN